MHPTFFLGRHFQTHPTKGIVGLLFSLSLTIKSTIMGC